MDNSKEGLIYQKRKTIYSPSFDSISEKQEEMSVDSIPSNKGNKIRNLNKKEKQTIRKNVLQGDDIINIERHKKSWIQNNRKNSFFLSIKKDDYKPKMSIRDSLTKKSKIMQNKKRLFNRNSVQDKGPILSKFALSKLTKSELKDKFKKSSLSNKSPHYFSIFNNSYSLQNNSLNMSPGKSFRRNFSNSKSNSNSMIEMKYINDMNMKKTILNKKNLDFSDKKQTSIFDEIKNSDIFEKSEQSIFKIKICYGILAFSSFLCIILNCADAITYNHKSLEYLKNYNNITFLKNINDLVYYSYINNRKISSKENTIRIFNGIFSLICVVILLIIHGIRHSVFENKKKFGKKERFNRILNQYYLKQRKQSMARNRLRKEDMKEKNNNEKVKMIDFNKYSENNDFTDEMSISKGKNRIVRRCIINLIFFPPYINWAFIGKYDNIFYIYSLNSIFLIISLYKISNIYRALFYLSPLNNSFNKAICKSNFINLNSRFMFKYSLHRFPLTFLTFNVLIIVFSICMLISCVEFFSLDINKSYKNNIIDNNVENVFNIFSAFFFLIIKNMHEEHCIKSILGKILLFIGGLFGMLISSYFIFLMNNLIKLNPEEHDSFSKLIKLLNPINREHKASNFIKSLLWIKKIIIDNKNTEKDYRNKIEQLKRPMYLQRRAIFHGDNNINFGFNENLTSNNLLNLNEENENIEKKRYFRYLLGIFIFKIKFIMEFKNFIDNLKVARNSSLSFNDVLKTIGNKMDGNIVHLSNKIEVLIQNDQKYIKFIKNFSNSLKNLKKIQNYQESMIQYLVDIHNEYLKQMNEVKKQAEFNSPILYKNKLNFPKKLKSNNFGKFNFKNKMIKSKIINNTNNKNKKKKLKLEKKDLKNKVRKQRSSIVFSNYLEKAMKESIKNVKEIQNSIKSGKSGKTNKSSPKRTRSLDDWKLITNDLKDKLKIRNSLISKTRKTSVSVIKNYKKSITKDF